MLSGSFGTSREEELEALREEVAHLQTALESRIVLEQAKGVLAERYELSMEDAYALLRYSARSARVKIHSLAAEVVERSGSPHAIVVGHARSVRWRAVAQRERAEASQARAAEQADRAARNVAGTRAHKRL